MCIDAPESTTNSLTSGFITDGAGRLHSLVRERKGALSFSLRSFRILLASLHTSPREHRTYLSGSLPEADPRMLESMDCADEDFELNHTKRWTFAFSNVCVKQCGF